MDLYIQLQPKLQAHTDCGVLQQTRPDQSVSRPPDLDKGAGQARQEVTALRAERTQYESQLRKANDKVTTLQQVSRNPTGGLGSSSPSLAHMQPARGCGAGDAAAGGPHTQEQQHGCSAAYQVPYRISELGLLRPFQV